MDNCLLWHPLHRLDGNTCEFTSNIIAMVLRPIFHPFLQRHFRMYASHQQNCRRTMEQIMKPHKNVLYGIIVYIGIFFVAPINHLSFQLELEGVRT